MDWAHRIGQKKPVLVFRLICEHTMEEKMIEKQTLKLKLDTLIIQKGRHAPKKQGFTKNELQDIVNFGADKIFATTDETLDQDIDWIIEEGVKAAADLKQRADENMKNKIDLTSFEVKPCGLYEFENEDFLEQWR